MANVRVSTALLRARIKTVQAREQAEYEKALERYEVELPKWVEKARAAVAKAALSVDENTPGGSRTDYGRSPARVFYTLAIDVPKRPEKPRKTNANQHKQALSTLDLVEADTLTVVIGSEPFGRYLS